MYLCVNLFGTNVRGNAARGTWQTVELSIPSLVATCSSCACDFDLEPGSGNSILPPGYAKILRRCINANNYNNSSNKRDKSSAMSFANSSGILAAAAHRIFCSFCPCVPVSFVSFFWATLSPCDVWGLAATLAPALAPCPPHAVLALCALRFPFAFYVLFIVAAVAVPPLFPFPSLAYFTTMCWLSDKQIRVAAAPHDVWVIYVYGTTASTLESTKKLCIRHVARHLNVHLIA